MFLRPCESSLVDSDCRFAAMLTHGLYPFGMLSTYVWLDSPILQFSERLFNLGDVDYVGKIE